MLQTIELASPESHYGEDDSMLQTVLNMNPDSHPSSILVHV